LRLSIVIPVYNERETLEELVSRVLAVEIALERELILVDDGSPTGRAISTRRIVSARRRGHPGRMQIATAAKGPPCARGSKHAIRRHRASFRMQTSSTTRRTTTPLLQAHPRGQGGRGVWLTLRRQRCAPRPPLSGTGGQPVHHHAFQHVHQPEPHRHGDLLQGFPQGGARRYQPCARTDSTSSRRSPRRLPDVSPNRKRWRIFEVGIGYAGRDFEEGKKITWLDGFPALWTIVKYRFVD
jgi:cellulose synthase/poly-beta-1,6-N-acetylglucosamine synthase-like glycosyltransferase